MWRDGGAVAGVEHGAGVRGLDGGSGGGCGTGVNGALVGDHLREQLLLA